MEKQEFKSKWDDLAREIGAEISPEIEQREEAALRAAQETAPPASSRSSEEPATSRTPLPKRSTPGWDSLASELGLPPVEPAAAASEDIPREREEVRPKPAKPEPRETPQARRPEPSGGEGRSERPGRDRRPERAGRERRPERSGGERKERQERTEPRRERKDRSEPSEHRREHRQERHERRDLDAEVANEDESKSVPEERQRSETPPPPREEPQKPAGMSLWHKIFGSPAEQSAKVSDETGRPDASAPSDLRDEPRAAGSGFADAHAEMPVQFREDADESAGPDEPSFAADETAPSDHRRGRPRRRGRGRGRGRKSEDRPLESRSSERRDKAPRLERQRPEIDDEFADDPLIDDDETEDLLGDDASDVEDENGAPSGKTSSRSASALTRTIPSWDEAIGFIVDANMQSRSQRRPPSRSGSRENSSRGRPRGRRKS